MSAKLDIRVHYSIPSDRNMPDILVNICKLNEHNLYFCKYTLLFVLNFLHKPLLHGTHSWFISYLNSQFTSWFWAHLHVCSILPNPHKQRSSVGSWGRGRGKLQFTQFTKLIYLLNHYMIHKCILCIHICT